MGHNNLQNYLNKSTPYDDTLYNTTIDNNNTTIRNQYLITYNCKTFCYDILKILVPVIVFICILVIAYYIIINIH